MKTFKLYLTEGGLNAQLKWLGALLLVIAITIAAVSVVNYFEFPEELANGYTPRDLIMQELYVAAGAAIIGLILLIGGTFAANGLDRKD
ncbi:hypothetical protein MYX06_05085 [Patescibacteria group bacterium AH-259-L05]|nr:hypothetical protein [Patescibacteria group bacterium AH-259-L05]